MEDRNIVAIEIGSSCIKGAIGTYTPAGVLTVHAVEEEPLLDWVRYGAVSNVEEVATLVSRIIRKIENRVSPRKITTVYVSLGGRSFRSVPRDVERHFVEDVEITDDVITQLFRDITSNPLPECEILKVVPREFVIDKASVSRPKGTVGRSIRMSANVITCRHQTKRNLERLFTDKLKMNIGGYEIRHMAIADAVLTSDERRLGCMLVDFGAETTTVSVYKDGHLQYMVTIPLGSRNITRDIQHLNYLEEQAEEIKRTVGNASGSMTSTQPMGSIDYTQVNHYVSHRAGEIIANIREQLRYAGFDSKTSDLPAGIIITGRGALLSGFNERLSQTLSMKIRTANVNIPQMRIADSRISPSDAADVLSILYAAACSGAVECLVEPVIERQPEPEYEPEHVSPVVEEIAPEPEVVKPRPRKHSFFDKVKDKVVGFMSESEDDDDDDDTMVDD